MSNILDPSTSATSALENAGESFNLIGFKTSSGDRLTGNLLRLTPQMVAFEIYSPSSVLQISEVLTEFKIVAADRTVYDDKATVHRIAHTGAATVCEATLMGLWKSEELLNLVNPEKVLSSAFSAFLHRWQTFYKLLPDYKLAVADLQSFLVELRLWLDQIELGFLSVPAEERLLAERKVTGDLCKRAAPLLQSLLERFERVAASIPLELAAAHRSFCRRQLHPLLLCSPFMHRIYAKPLGYAGDYEMVNMILRDPCEGGSLFARLLNVFILSQAPAEAHRNRVKHLVQRLVEETNRSFHQSGSCRIFSLGCGPAGEVQHFLAKHDLSERAQFTLLDANDETLEYTGKVLEHLKKKHHRPTTIKLLKLSVQQLLKTASKRVAVGEEYDFIYCAGLFDYLSDRICRTLLGLTYSLLAPGGLLLATNVDAVNPIRNIMEHFYDWHVIHRTGAQLHELASELPAAAATSVWADQTTNNIFLEVRKPGSNS